MSPVQLQLHEGRIAQLTLASGRGNPLTPDLIAAARQHLADLAGDGTRALVIDAAGSPGGKTPIFSGGFPLPLIAHWDRPAIHEFFSGFLALSRAILTFPAPTIVAVDGHTIAAGFILTLSPDLRVVREGPLKLGLSEVDLGIAVPKGPLTLLAARTSRQTALRLGMLGQLIGPNEALRIGYADRLADDARAVALEIASELAGKPGHGAALTSTFCSEGLAREVDAADADGMERFLDTWFSPEGQAGLKAMAARLGGRR